jgi:hypothetical protein
MKLFRSDTRPLWDDKANKGVRDLEFAHVSRVFRKRKISPRLIRFLFDPLFSQRVDSK